VQCSFLLDRALQSFTAIGRRSSEILHNRAEKGEMKTSAVKDKTAENYRPGRPNYGVRLSVERNCGV